MPFPALRHRDFTRLWLALGLSQLGTQVQSAALAWQLYELTKSPLLLGGLGLVRTVPLVLCALFAGVVADAVDRRRLLIATQSVMLLISAALAALTMLGQISAPSIYVLVALGGAASAFDDPARQALVAGLVPVESLGNAMSLNAIAFQLASVFGPAVAGLLLASSTPHGAAICYVLNAVSFALPIAALLLYTPRPLPPSPPPSWNTERGHASLPPVGKAARLLPAVREGISFVRRQPVLWSMMWMDAIATFFAGSLLLLPIFASDLLGTGARGYGLLVAAPSAGAAIAAAMMAARQPVRRAGATVLGSIVVYGLATTFFGMSRSFPLALLLLAIAGAADTVSMVVRQTVRNKLTPDALRGRMVSINMIFFIGGPQMGEAEAGLVAQAFGPRISVASGGVACVVAALVAAVVMPALVKFRDE